MGIKYRVKQVLINKQNIRYEKALSQRKVSYDQWVREQEKNGTVGGRGCSGSGAGTYVNTSGCGNFKDFVVWRQAAGKVAQGAQEEIGAFFVQNPEAEIVYGDEDLLLPDGRRDQPWYKPCWSPDTYRSFFYPGSLIAVRRSLLERAGITEGQREVIFTEAAGLRCLMDRIFLAAGGFERGCRAIGHLERMLFHVSDAGVWEEYQRAAQSPALENAPLKSCNVSVVIPSKDNPQALEKCLSSLKKSMDAVRQSPGGAVSFSMEVVVVDNGSSPENRARIEQLTQGMQYCYEPAEFNFSAMCNRGAKAAKGNLLLFLNDDMEMCGDDWLAQMAGRACLPYVGAVGLKLYYPESVRIQHDGIVNLPVGPVHKLQFFEDNKCYYFARNLHTCNCVAVTGACLMVEAEKFWEAGGFQEKLPVAYNDVALCFSLLESGYWNVVLNDRHAWHHESLSRGSDESREKQQRLAGERKLLYRLHPAFAGKDPYYPAGLNREGLDARILPGYISCRNRVQDGGWKPFTRALEEMRRDECLMVRVETAGPEKIQGYGVVLGDNNACYEKRLLLLPEKEDVRPVSMVLEGQYRQDLEENLPDQVHVALGGFCVARKGENLEKGNYRIAMVATNRVTGLRLWNESGKYLTVE